MEWGGHVGLLERSRKRGNATALDFRPILYDELEFFMEAFAFLSNTRASGCGLLISEIAVYGSLLDVRSLLNFVRMVKLIDNIYTKTSQEKVSG